MIYRERDMMEWGPRELRMRIYMHEYILFKGNKKKGKDIIDRGVPRQSELY